VAYLVKGSIGEGCYGQGGGPSQSVSDPSYGMVPFFR